MKRILQIVPSLEMGGVERTTIQVAKTIKYNKMIPLVISSGGKMVSELNKESIQHIQLWVNSKNPLIIFINIFIIAFIIFLKKIDIVHARSRAPAWSAYFACKLTGCKFITTFHGYYSGYDNFIKNYYNSVMTKGKKVIVSTDFMKTHLLKNYKIFNNKIIKIPRGVEINKFNNISKDRILKIKKKYNIDNEYIVTLPGRLTNWKGQFIFLNAIKLLNLKNIKYIMVGDGCKKYKDKIHNFIKSNKINVIVDDNCIDIPAIYQISDIILSCSIQEETFGRVVVEGMASGKIVIASNLGGSKETIINNKSGFLIEPNNSIALAETIENVYYKKISLIKNNIVNQSKQFSLEKFNDNIIKLYKSI